METTVTMTTTSVDEEPPTGGEDAACPTGLAFGDWAEEWEVDPPQDGFSWCLALRPQVPSVFWKLGVRHQVCCWPWYTTPCKMLQLPTKAVGRV